MTINIQIQVQSTDPKLAKKLKKAVAKILENVDSTPVDYTIDESFSSTTRRLLGYGGPRGFARGHIAPEDV